VAIEILKCSVEDADNIGKEEQELLDTLVTLLHDKKTL
jgi:hypothetical protein